MNQRTPRTGSPSLARIVVGLIVMLCGVAGFGATAAAGGWAVTTLDEAPIPVPGQAVDVGFTIRQHGVTPVDLDEGVGIQIVSAEGTAQHFPAVRQGATGHYVASVVFPAAGDYTWSVQQGWFAPQDLGALTVGPAPGTGDGDAAGGDRRFPAVLRYGLPALAAALAVLAVADLLVTRRRRRTVVA